MRMLRLKGWRGWGRVGEGCLGVGLLILERLGRGSRGKGIRSSREGWTSDDQFPEFWQSNPLGGVAFKDPPQDGIKIRRQGQDRLKEVLVFQVSPEGRIFRRGSFPWIAAACEVYQDHSQAPDVIGR